VRPAPAAGARHEHPGPARPPRLTRRSRARRRRWSRSGRARPVDPGQAKRGPKDRRARRSGNDSLAPPGVAAPPMPQTAASPSRLAGLDLLRSLAVVAVVLHHYPKADSQIWLRALAHYGWAGLDLFFVLSGDLIAGQFFG